MDGLLEGHEPGVDKAHDHDRCGRRRLDDGRHAETGQKACELASGELPEQRLELPARTLFERRAHDVHAEQKQAQAADQIQNVK